MLIQGRYLVRKPYQKSSKFSVVVRDTLTGKTYNRSLHAESMSAAKKNLGPVVEVLIQEIEGGPKEESRGPVFGEASKGLLESRRGIAYSTYRDYEIMSEVQGEFFGQDVELSKITKKDVARFIGHLQGQGRSARTIQKHLTWLKAVFSWEDVSYPGENLAKPKGAYKERQALSVEQVSSMLSGTKGWLKTAIVIGVYTGLRPGNIVRLEWRHVDLDSGTIRIPAGETKSRQRDFTTVIHPALHRELLRAKLRGSNSVIGNEVKHFTRQFQRAASDIGVHDVVPYCLRHTFNSLIAPIATEVLRARLMGHSPSSNLGSRYYHSTDDDLRSVINQLPDFQSQHVEEGIKTEVI